jgi:GNAT superfamily N-acetyltransferase
MYVEPELRRQGVAKGILEHLEGAASTLGARRLVLETGIHQEEAIGLYLRAGFAQVECWGEYAAAPTSVCYQKML